MLRSLSSLSTPSFSLFRSPTFQSRLCLTSHARSSRILCRHFSTPPTSPPKPSENHLNSSEPSEPLNLEAKPTREQRIEEFKQVLRDWVERTSILIRHRADDYTAHAASTFAQLGRELNKVTGYGEIELLKKRVVAQGVYILNSSDVES